MSDPRPSRRLVRPSSGVACSKSVLRYWQPVLILIILNLKFLMQVVLSATLSRLLPLQLGFEHIQYINLR